MKKILGLDLGSTSIGWAFLLEDEETTHILRAGTHIVFASTKDVDEFTKGQKQTINEVRRAKRSARRNLQRYKIRRASLLKKLTELGLLPSMDSLKNLDKFELYGLRAKAIKEKLSPEELGRVFFHLNQRRGYKSNRKTDLKDNQKETDFVQHMADRSTILHEKFMTVGEYCNEQLQADPHFRIKDRIFLRADYVAEFNKIWETQKKYYPKILTDDNLRQIRDRIIYFQRRLKSAKHLVSMCQFEKDVRVCPRSSPYHQLRRVFQDVNNLRITRIADRKDISPKEMVDKRKKILPELEYKGSLTESKILTLLDLKRTEYKVNLAKDEKGQDSKALRGNRTKFQIQKALEESGWSDMSILEFDFTKEADTQPLYRLWHLLYSSEDPEKLMAKLKERYKFSDEQANALVHKVNLESDYSSLSVKATKKILPFLMEGKMYSEACDAAGYRHSDYLTTEENLKRELIDKLPLLKWNSLRNPAVEKILNHLINIVNAIIDDPELGRPDEIRVELARELQKNAQDRQYMTKRMAETTARHEDIISKLREQFPGRRVSRGDIEKYKLWEEFGCVSPYEPNKYIGITDLFDKSLYEVEHIIPKARLFDDSFANKTIASTKVNRAKGDMTAHDYMNSRSDQDRAAFKSCVDAYWTQHKIGKKKFEYLNMPQSEIPQDFINRQLNETAYITKKAMEILRQCCRDVRATSGTVTDYLRHIWGMNNILQELNWEHYEKLGRIKELVDEETGVIKKVIDKWSKRDDHRHHAVDAIVIAATKQSTVQRLNLLNQWYSDYKGKSRDMKESGPKIPPPASDFFDQAKNAIASVLVSFKAGKRVATKKKSKFRQHGGHTGWQQQWTPRGFLHKETIYGTIRQQRKVELNARFDRAADIINPVVREIVIARLAEHKNDPKKAFAKLDKNPIFFDETKSKPITIVSVFEEDYVVRVPLSVTFKEKNVVDIVDKAVREVISARLDQYGGKSREAFKDLENNPVWLNKEAGIVIKSVRMKIGGKALTPIHRDAETDKLKDFVFTQNNHHVAIYQDEEGNRFEEVVTLWDALDRKITGQEIIKRFDDKGRKLLISMQRNELYVFGLDPEKIDLSDPKNYPNISKRMYRVQKLATYNYCFRHHLATTLEDDSTMKTFHSHSEFHGAKINLTRVNRIQAYQTF